VPPTVPTDPNSGAIARVVNTAASGLPVTVTPDPAAWTLDEEAAPRRSGRRRGTPTTAPAPARTKKQKSPKVGTLVPGKGTAGAARLLVLALVVGFEGLAVTSLARTAQTEPEPHEQLGVIPESAAVLAEADGREHAALVAQEESHTLAVAQDKSGSAKVAAADRVRAAAERREAVLRNAREDPRSVAKLMLADRGWGSSQFSCLNSLWNKESRWEYTAQNPSSGAYGIPQALPGTKMASAGSDWRTNPITQIEWGLDYIADRYGTPCAAWGHSQDVGWY
jgi:murein DD-endopeptidase MepM/ murein hydrolase activator NlpD